MNLKIELVKGDITRLDVDAIVNAANQSLLGGGGVDGAIHRSAGSDLLAECRSLNGCDTGQAKITKGYLLKARFVIHAVGPVWHGGNNNEDQLLASCYHQSLKLTRHYEIKSIAFPNISTGIYGFPKERAAKIAIQTIRDFINDNQDLEQILFCCFDQENYFIYKNLLNQ